MFTYPKYTSTCHLGTTLNLLYLPQVQDRNPPVDIYIFNNDAGIIQYLILCVGGRNEIQFSELTIRLLLQPLVDIRPRASDHRPISILVVCTIGNCDVIVNLLQRSILKHFRQVIAPKVEVVGSAQLKQVV